MNFDDLLISQYEPRWQGNRKRPANQRLVVSLRPLRAEDRHSVAEASTAFLRAKAEERLAASKALHLARVGALETRIASAKFAGEELERDKLTEYPELVDELFTAAGQAAHLREGYRAEELREDAMKLEHSEAVDRLVAIIVQLQGGDGVGEGNG